MNKLSGFAKSMIFMLALLVWIISYSLHLEFFMSEKPETTLAAVILASFYTVVFCFVAAKITKCCSAHRVFENNEKVINKYRANGYCSEQNKKKPQTRAEKNNRKRMAKKSKAKNRKKK